MEYPADDLTPEERDRIAPHFTDLDGPVFALTNLPETVKGALFARYSRYPGTLRRLFLAEFADSLPAGGALDGDEGRRAAELYERIFVGYGDDSVAQLGGAHVACEWTSNVLTKILQRPRLGAYLEQSTRYIAYDAPMPGGGYRYYRDAGARPGVRGRDGLPVRDVRGRAPARARVGGRDVPARRRRGAGPRARAVNAKALDLLRGLLPAASLSHMGIYATGQAYEQLILHLIGHPLPEARRYGELILAAIKAVMPSFVARVERPDRGGAWATFLQHRRAAAEHWTARLGLEREQEAEDRARRSAAARRRRRGPAARRAAVRGGRHAEERTLAAVAALGDESARACSPTSSASAPTAATAPAAASRRSATASRSCPTTARSATSSATGC